MSRPCARWTAAIEDFDDHPETRHLPYTERTLCDQIVKHCSSKKMVDGVITRSVIRRILSITGKSEPTLRRYREALVKSEFIVLREDGNYFSALTQRICSAACRNATNQNVSEKIVKKFFTPEKSTGPSESADTQKTKPPSSVPNLKETLSKKLKADEHMPGTANLEPRAGLPANAPSRPPKHRRIIDDTRARVPEAWVARGRGVPEKGPAAAVAQDNDSIGGILAKFLANNPAALAAQGMDFGAMSTEEVLAWEKQQEDAKLLDAPQDRAADLKAAQEAQLLDEPHSGKSPKRRKASKVSSAYRDMVNDHLTRFAGSVAGFRAGAREVNTVCKIGPSEHQLVNCLDIARRKIQNSVVVNPGGYLNNTLRNVVAGIVPPRKALPCKLC